MAAYVEDVRTRLIAIPTVMVGTDGAATVADGWDAGLATILDNFSPARIGYLDQLDFNLQELLNTIAGYLDTEIQSIIDDIGVFPTVNYATLAAYVEDVRTRLIAIVADTGTIVWGDVTTIKGLVDSAEAVGPFAYLDAGGEQDVYEDATVVRRRIWVVVSNSGMAQNGKFRIYRKVDGSNYDLYIEQTVLVAAGEERAWDREFTTNQHWKITYEEDVDEGAARAIPFNVIVQVIE